MAFIQPPAPVNSGPVRIRGGYNDIGGVDGASEQRGVHGRRVKSALADQPAGVRGLLPAARGERKVQPAPEYVVGVGGAFTMPQQQENAVIGLVWVAHVSDSPRSSALIWSTRS